MTLEPQTYDAEPCFMQATKLWGARVMRPRCETRCDSVCLTREHLPSRR